MKQRRTRFADAPRAARVAWRPSAWPIVVLVAMGMLASIGALASDLPVAWAVGVGTVAATAGVLQARREARRAHRALAIDSGGMTLDGRPLRQVTLHWRGPLAFLWARDQAGRVHRLAWWPDTLDAAGRRALRLAVATHSRPTPT
ncbi:hypothetical protein LVB87_10975 [Lysobacter sp. KIS68-7]|uniref:hypothetical protein n=1 Tax=Lysobacter sp. KIS68-7 TaxID=2904252 RepID=UPI001E355F8E|nr:hypothetical protein [Lysobacter sp. KIS68-7]UHQ18710.1 hypothetical protein LVB87_10975 [Lysobacter sp. KIS68-7]